MQRIAILQAQEGIGDVVWHLPYIRAIAETSPSGTVTFLSRPSSQAHEILEGESLIEQVLYYEARGSELMRGWHLAKLVRLLRSHRFNTLWILDRSSRAALAALLAGIPKRIGLGLGRQALLISNQGIPGEHIHHHPLTKLDALMDSMNIRLATTEPNLRLPPARLQRVSERFSSYERPWRILAFGATPPKDWPETSWLTFIALLRARISGTIFLIGGPNYQSRARRALAETSGCSLVNACDLSLGEAAALIKLADLFVGPDSGPMNLSAAVRTPTYGLFGASPVLTYSAHIHPIRPDDGRPHSPDGMQFISPERVLVEVNMSPYPTYADRSGTGPMT
jgi:heptosyltransferase II